MSGVCLASTVLRPGPLLEPFIRYHLLLGFDHIFLFFDDPSDPSADTPQTNRVTVIRSTEPCRRKQLDAAQQLANAGHGRFPGEYPSILAPGLIDQTGPPGLIVRQQLNLASALAFARNKDLDWLVSIDVDEAFHPADQSVQEHFSELSGNDVRFVRYLNHEAVPEGVDVHNPFSEVDLFLLNPSVAPDSGQKWSELGVFGDRPYFRAYSNGKPAVRVAEDAAPSGSHRFRRLGRDWPARHVRKFADPCVLHYAECGFGQFQQKYLELGDFADEYFPGAPTVPWLRRCRDICRRSDLDEMRSFYKRHVIADPGVAAALLSSGLCRRFEGPAQILRPG